MVAFPKRSKPFYSYVPLVSVVALFWWITGLGLWIHYTMVAQNNSKDYIAILQVAVDSGVASKTNQIYNSMIATSIVFALFAVCIHALGIWRGLVEAEQDVGGQVDDFSNDWIMYANVATQIAWWVIVLWLTVLLTGFGAFAALIYTVKSGTANIVAMQALITASGAQVLPILPGYCPTACLSILPTGLFIYSGQDQSTLTLCVCDGPTLNSALDAITKANNAVPGMLVGVLFMVAYGIVLLAYLVAMLTRTNTEQGVSERLLSQGWAESAAPNRTVATRRG